VADSKKTKILESQREGGAQYNKYKIMKSCSNLDAKSRYAIYTKI
jgi:hypothetical protein